MAIDLAGTLKACRNDAVMFVRTFLPGIEPDEWQIEALTAISKGDKLAIRSGHGVGKGAFLSWTLLWFLLTRYPARIAVTAPTSGQLETVLWSEIAKWRRHLLPPLTNYVAVTKLKVSVRNSKESFAIGKTSRAERPEALQGYHSQNMLFLIDEASGVPDQVFEVAEGALSTPGAKVVLTGNPTRANGYFWKAFQSPVWHKMHVNGLKAKMVDDAFINKMRSEYGEESNTFRVRVLGEWPLQEEDALISTDWLENAMLQGVPDPLPDGPVIWGVDVARYGSDRSALVKRCRGVIIERAKHWSGSSIMESANRIAVEYSVAENKPAEIYVDTIGIGAGVVDRLRELGLPVYGVDVSNKASKNTAYSRLRDELWWRVRAAFERGDMRMPRDEDLAGELAGIRYSYTATGKLSIESKESMRRRGGKSPDLADALMLTYQNPFDTVEVPEIRPYRRVASWMGV